jgi:hypothetical protein
MGSPTSRPFPQDVACIPEGTQASTHPIKASGRRPTPPPTLIQTNYQLGPGEPPAVADLRGCSTMRCAPGFSLTSPASLSSRAALRSPIAVLWKARRRIVGNRGHAFVVVKAIGRELYVVLAWEVSDETRRKRAEIGMCREWGYTGSVP